MNNNQKYTVLLLGWLLSTAGLCAMENKPCVVTALDMTCLRDYLQFDMILNRFDVRGAFTFFQAHIDYLSPNQQTFWAERLLRTYVMLFHYEDAIAFVGWLKDWRTIELPTIHYWRDWIRTQLLDHLAMVPRETQARCFCLLAAL